MAKEFFEGVLYYLVLNITDILSSSRSNQTRGVMSVTLTLFFSGLTSCFSMHHDINRLKLISPVQS